MVDPQLREFRGRLRRVDRIHRRGGGFEAVGTLGRSHFAARAPRRVSILRPLLLVVGCALVLKAMLYMQIGPVDYSDRVERLRQGSGVERIGAYVLQADTVTVWLGTFFAEVLRKPI